MLFHTLDKIIIFPLCPSLLPLKFIHSHPLDKRDVILQCVFPWALGNGSLVKTVSIQPWQEIWLLPLFDCDYLKFSFLWYEFVCISLNLKIVSLHGNWDFFLSFFAWFVFLTTKGILEISDKGFTILNRLFLSLNFIKKNCHLQSLQNLSWRTKIQGR